MDHKHPTLPETAAADAGGEGKVFFTTKELPTETRNGLYCTWVRQNERPGAPLVAVWIDPAMGAFEKGSTREPALTQEMLACADDAGQTVPPPGRQGRAVRQNQWLLAVRGFAAVLVWMLLTIAASAQTSGGITGVGHDQSGNPWSKHGDQEPDYRCIAGPWLELGDHFRSTSRTKQGSATSQLIQPPGWRRTSSKNSARPVRAACWRRRRWDSEQSNLLVENDLIPSQEKIYELLSLEEPRHEDIVEISELNSGEVLATLFDLGR